MSATIYSLYIGRNHRIPPIITIIALTICIAPLVLYLLGIDLGSEQSTLNSDTIASLSGLELSTYLHRALSGSITHVILEWSAFCIAIVTVAIAFIHYQITRDAAIFVICIALFFSGIMNAFHTLAACKIYTANAANNNFVPLTWAVARMFNAGIMILGPTYFILSLKSKEMSPKKLIIVIAVTGIIAFLLIEAMSLSHNLPQTQFPDAVIKRPYDVIPLVLYGIALIFIYPMFHKQKNSAFSYSLVLAAVVSIFVEAYMAFGSDELYDNFFNVAHFLKITAYLIPFLGLIIDYKDTYKREQESQERLIEQAIKLRKSNQALDDFAYIASHDLKEPLRGIHNAAQFVYEDYENSLDENGVKLLSSIKGLSLRMQQLIDNLLKYSRIGHEELDLKDYWFDVVITPQGK